MVGRLRYELGGLVTLCRYLCHPCIPRSKIQSWFQRKAVRTTYLCVPLHLCASALKSAVETSG